MKQLTGAALQIITLGSRKYPYPSQGVVIYRKFQGGGGVSKAKHLKEKYKAIKLEFPGEMWGGGKSKNLRGGV